MPITLYEPAWMLARRKGHDKTSRPKEPRNHLVFDRNERMREVTASQARAIRMQILPRNAIPPSTAKRSTTTTNKRTTKRPQIQREQDKFPSSGTDACFILPLSMKATTYTPGSSSADLHRVWEDSIAALHSAYSLPADKFHSLLNADDAVAFVVQDNDKPIGFALTYLFRVGMESDPAMQHFKGGLAAIAVVPESQGKGVGTALHAAAMEHLTLKVRESLKASNPPASKSVIQLGSTFPRIFPGLPTVLPSKSWFEHRGWTFNSSTEIDLYGRIPTGVDQEQWKKVAHENGVAFRPATEGDEDELMAMQKESFFNIPGWPDMFVKLIRAGRAADIHLAVNKDNHIIGATVAAMPGSPMTELLAWPVTLGKACASIACVGVSEKARGTGAGMGVVAAAIEELERRGADGVFIDWVSLKGFYERFGTTQWEAPYWMSDKTVTGG